ncbi:MAG: leucine-rich repeat domain-containing protein, partial [Eubacteriales bacterium]
MKKIRLLAGACVTLFVLLFAQPVFAQDTFEMAGTTLVTYHGTESVVNVPEGVTAIGEKAFYQNTSITEVKLPETLTYISTSAFQGCTSLQTINFPVGMIEIQNAAFKNCTSLQSAQFPRGLSSLGAQSFYNCTGLVDVFAYEHLGAIGSECFRYCDNLTVHCPQSSFIGGYAELIGAGTETFNYEATGDFILDGSLLVSYLGSDTEVTLPESVTEIGAYAFAGNTDITTLNITSQLSRIQPYAFFGCENLISVTAQTGIQRLDAYAFSGCSHLTNIALSGSYTIVPQGAFQGCNALTEVTLPSNVTLLSDYAFAGCTALSALPQTGALAGIGNYAFSGCDGLTQVTLPDTVAWLGNAAFADCSYLTDFVFPTNLTDTGNKTLKNCVALESVLLPTGLRTVGTSVFEGCTSLFEVSLPDTVTTIGAKAFKSTKLTLLSFPDDLTTIGDQAFYGALNDISVFVPASVAYFGDDVFGACQDIIIQCYYQSDAFEYAASNGIDYELVGDADNPFLIDDGALIRYFGLDTEVTIPEEVTIIGENAFMNKTAMVSVNLPDGLIEIQKGAFENCRSLTSVFLPAGVTEVGSEAFANCTGLTELTVVGADTAFEADAFLGAADFMVNIYFGADAETYFLAKGYTVIYLEDDEPVENIVLNDYPSSVLGDEGVVISGQVLKHGQIAPNADYRIAYRLEGDAWWTYHSTDFQPCGDDGGFNETIRLPEEGRYTFLIEAKTSASTTAEIAEETQTTAVYFKAFPVSQIVSLSADKAALLAGEEIGLSFEIEYEKEAQPVQLCIEYSLDSETWSHTGSEWSEPIMLGGNSGTVLFATPSDLPEGEYTIRLSLRADGREAADVSAECTAWLYQVMPIKSVTFTEEPGTWVATSAGITLSAAAEGYAGYETNAQYCFYYAYNGGAFKKLRGWGSDATVVFKPRSEGAYVFKVEAKSGGRASVDAEYTTKTQMVYLGAVPASNLEVAVEKESFEYGEPIKVNIMLEEGRDEQTTLYQVQYAKAGSKRFYGLTEWEEYALEEGQVWLKTHVLIPPNRLDATYQIRVVVKTVGRKKADVYETKEVAVCVGEALGTVALMPMDNIVVMDGRGLMLQAEAQKSDGTQAYAEYRFSYRVSGTRGWKYISKKFAYSSES